MDMGTEEVGQANDSLAVLFRDLDIGMEFHRNFVNESVQLEDIPVNIIL